MIKAAIFDLDGTLLDSMGIWARIDIDFLADRSIEIPPDYTEQMGRLGFLEGAEYTIERFGLADSPARLIAEWNERAAAAYRESIALKDGAFTYLKGLRDRGIRLGVATSLSAKLLKPALIRHGIYEWFEMICTTREEGRGKEFPDIYLRTAKGLFTEPAECIVYEDILPAVYSAKAAGMKVCGVYDEYSKKDWPKIRAAADLVCLDYQSLPYPE